MSLPAFTNEWGDHTLYKPSEWVEKVWRANGSYEEYHHWFEYPASQSVRKGKSNNPIQLLGSLPWRSPSGYRRAVGRVTPIEGVQSQTKDGVRREEHYSGFREWPFSWQFEEGAIGDFPLFTWSDELENECIAKAISRIKDRKVSLSENLAESVKTFDSLVENGRLLIKLLSAVRHGRWSSTVGPHGALRTTADGLLQYKYGWRPLMSDIYGGYQLLKRGAERKFLLSATAKATRNTGFVSGGEYSRQGDIRRSMKIKLIGALTDHERHITDQLGVANPLSLAWELVPMSLVVDWFVPIGNVLDSLVPPAGVDFVGGYVTQLGTANYTTVRSAFSDWAGNRGSNLNECFDLNRKPYGAWPKAGLYTASPFGNNLGAGLSHLESTFAFLIQKLFK